MPGAPKSEAFESVYAEHYATILAYLQRLTRRRDLAEELAQETFLRVGRGLDGFRGGSKIATWIYRIATNVYLDQHRKAPVPGHFLEESEGSPGEPSGVSGRSLPKLADRLFEESEMGNCIRSSRLAALELFRSPKVYPFFTGSVQSEWRGRTCA
jgi:RNA polymerase sigma factor (sigma-70 family)